LIDEKRRGGTRTIKIMMQKNTNCQLGLFNPRVLIAFTLCSVGVLLATFSFATTPSSGATDLRPDDNLLVAKHRSQLNSNATAGDIAWAWGSSSRGQLGNGTTFDRPTPTSVSMPAGVRFSAVSGGYIHSVALDTLGNAWAFGDNFYGQLGNGTNTYSTTPIPVTMPAGVTFKAVTAGAFHSVALDTSGNAWAWGSNGEGELGIGTLDNSAIPTAVVMPPGVTFVAISAGFQDTLALDNLGRAWAWGDNNQGELGNGLISGNAPNLVPEPVTMPAGVFFKAIAAGAYHSVALDTSGNAWAWGFNFDGELGNGTTNQAGACFCNPVPGAVNMPAGVTFSAIGAGAYFGVGLDTTGKAWTWGYNQDGELGNGNTTSSTIPTAVSMPPGVTFSAIAPGDCGYFSVALDSTGKAWAWGYDAEGELGGGDGSKRAPVAASMPAGVTFSAVAAGARHSLALAPPPVQLLSVVSALTHGSAGTFDIDLPLTGNLGIECRRGGANGDYTLVFSFTNSLTSVGGANLTSGTGAVDNSAIGTDPHEYVINLTGVANAQTITVSLTNVIDSAGNSSPAIAGSMAVLLGDVNGNGVVSNTDVAAVKSQVAAAIDSSNFRSDVDANGVISNTDVSTVKAQVGTSLP
jgi:alpha-tubulin suppressor-like RCC1 family protein